MNNPSLDSKKIHIMINKSPIIPFSHIHSEYPTRQTLPSFSSVKNTVLMARICGTSPDFLEIYANDYKSTIFPKPEFRGMKILVGPSGIHQL